MRGVFDNNVHLGESMADLVRAGEVAGGSRGGAFVDQALDIVIIGSIGLGGGKDIEHRVDLVEGMAEQTANLV